MTQNQRICSFFAVAWTGIVNETMRNDEYFLKYESVDFLLSAAQAFQGYASADIIRDHYFHPEEMGNWDAMAPGLRDVTLIKCIVRFIL